MFKLAICDDESNFRQQLNLLVNEYNAKRNETIVVSIFSNASQILDCNAQFDIYLLDILMPGLNGIELASEIRARDESADIIFLTSSPEFALESYSVNAADYLLKPIVKEHLFSTLDRTISLKLNRIKDTLVIRNNRYLISILISDIEYVEIRRNKLVFRLHNGSTTESVGTLSALEDQLLSHLQFLKPHRSYLVNMDYIHELNSHELLFSDFFPPVPVARGHFPIVKASYLEYMTFTMKQGDNI